MTGHDPRYFALSVFLLGVALGILVTLLWLGLFP